MVDPTIDAAKTALKANVAAMKRVSIWLESCNQQQTQRTNGPNGIASDIILTIQGVEASLRLTHTTVSNYTTNFRKSAAHFDGPATYAYDDFDFDVGLTAASSPVGPPSPPAGPLSASTSTSKARSFNYQLVSSDSSPPDSTNITSHGGGNAISCASNDCHRSHIPVDKGTGEARVLNEPSHQYKLSSSSHCGFCCNASSASSNHHAQMDTTGYFGTRRDEQCELPTLRLSLPAAPTQNLVNVTYVQPLEVEEHQQQQCQQMIANDFEIPTNADSPVGMSTLSPIVTNGTGLNRSYGRIRRTSRTNKSSSYEGGCTKFNGVDGFSSCNDSDEDFLTLVPCQDFPVGNEDHEVTTEEQVDVVQDEDGTLSSSESTSDRSSSSGLNPFVTSHQSCSGSVFSAWTDQGASDNIDDDSIDLHPNSEHISADEDGDGNTHNSTANPSQWVFVSSSNDTEYQYNDETAKNHDSWICRCPVATSFSSDEDDDSDENYHPIVPSSADNSGSRHPETKIDDGPSERDAVDQGGDAAALMNFLVTESMDLALSVGNDALEASFVGISEITDKAFARKKRVSLGEMSPLMPNIVQKTEKMQPSRYKDTSNSMVTELLRSHETKN